MLRVGEERDGGVFLDDVTVAELERKLNVTVRIVEQNGADLLNAMIGA
jgi:NifB/MoaA-like Fe-S oxidoreductase